MMFLVATNVVASRPPNGDWLERPLLVPTDNVFTPWSEHSFYEKRARRRNDDDPENNDVSGRPNADRLERRTLVPIVVNVKSE